MVLHSGVGGGAHRFEALQASHVACTHPSPMLMRMAELEERRSDMPPKNRMAVAMMAVGCGRGRAVKIQGAAVRLADGCSAFRHGAHDLSRPGTLLRVDAAAHLRKNLASCLFALMPCAYGGAVQKHPSRISLPVSLRADAFGWGQCGAGNSPQPPLTWALRTHQHPSQPLRTSFPSDSLLSRILAPFSR